MAVTISKRPEGHTTYVLHEGSLDFSNGPKTGGFRVIINLSSHGITNGDIIYLETPIESYNGFFYAHLASANAFSLQTMDIPFASDSDLDIDFVKNIVADGLIRRNRVTHSWSCVHLPIVYELTNNLSPVSDAFATVSGFTDSSGNTSLTFGGAFSGSGLSANNTHVKIVGSSVDGIYRIIDTSVTLIIDLPYDASNLLIGSVVYVYYNNYHVRIQVYGGLTDAHFWEDRKPYELVSTLKLIPDNDNEILFSVSNELKKQVKTLNNNLTLDTLPNNIDAFTMFYVTTQESYDFLDGGDIVTHTESIVSDKMNFEGFAVNAKLPFKNIDSGYMSEYLVDIDSLMAKFLTLFETPVIFDGYYFDISILLNFNNIIYYDLPVLYFRKKWLNAAGTTLLEETEQIINYDAGLYRLSIQANCNYSQLKVAIASTFAIQNENSEFTTDITGWTNTNLDGDFSNWSWSSSNGGSANSNTIGTPTKFFLQNYDLFLGRVIRISAQVVVTSVSGSGNNSFDIVTVNGSSIVSTNSTTITGAGTFNMIFNITVASAATKIGFRARQIAAAEYQYFVTFFRVEIPENLTEEKTIDIACNCNEQGIQGTQLTWLNYLGAMESFVFTGQTEHQIDIKEAKTRLVNIFPTWSKSYGAFSNTIRQETMRKSCFRKTLRSQLISIDNLDAMQYIKSSSLVQIINGVNDLRTVLVDTDSFTVYQDNDKEFSISFAVEYTDYIPSQTL